VPSKPGDDKLCPGVGKRTFPRDHDAVATANCSTVSLKTPARTSSAAGAGQQLSAGLRGFDGPPRDGHLAWQSRVPRVKARQVGRPAVAGPDRALSAMIVFGAKQIHRGRAGERGKLSRRSPGTAIVVRPPLGSSLSGSGRDPTKTRARWHAPVNRRSWPGRGSQRPRILSQRVGPPDPKAVSYRQAQACRKFEAHSPRLTRQCAKWQTHSRSQPP